MRPLFLQLENRDNTHPVIPVTTDGLHNTFDTWTINVWKRRRDRSEPLSRIKMSCVISVPLVFQREQQKLTCFINNVNVAVSVMLKPKSFVSFLIKAMGIAFIDTYCIL